MLSQSPNRTGRKITNKMRTQPTPPHISTAPWKETCVGAASPAGKRRTRPCGHLPTACRVRVIAGRRRRRRPLPLMTASCTEAFLSAGRTGCCCGGCGVDVGSGCDGCYGGYYGYCDDCCYGGCGYCCRHCCGVATFRAVTPRLLTAAGSTNRGSSSPSSSPTGTQVLSSLFH